MKALKIDSAKKEVSEVDISNLADIKTIVSPEGNEVADYFYWERKDQDWNPVYHTLFVESQNNFWQMPLHTRFFQVDEQVYRGNGVIAGGRPSNLQEYNQKYAITSAGVKWIEGEDLRLYLNTSLRKLKEFVNETIYEAPKAKAMESIDGINKLLESLN